MSSDNEVPGDLRYSKEHEWVRVKGDEVTVGITAFAVGQLGDVTLVNWDVEEGERVEAGQVFGTIESVKALSDLFAPLTGTVVQLNAALEDAPERVNEDCWGDGWMLVIKPEDPESIEELLDPEAYRAHVAAQEA